MRIWITGASTGIGAATAHELARRGHTLFLTARSEDKLAELPGEARPGDVTDRDAMHRIAEDIAPLDVALLNAGTYVPVDPRELDAAVFREHLDVNVMGTVHCIEAVLPAMLELRHGRIAVVASVTGYAALPRAAAYGATKAFLISMADSLRADLAGTGVDVTVINPGYVRTPLTAKNEFKMPFLIDPDEAARTIADGLEAGKPEISFPLPMALAMKALGSLPGALSRRYTARLSKRLRHDETPS
jgi:short-subunit dehydrogenase